MDEAAPSGLGFATTQALKSAVRHIYHGMGRKTSVEGGLFRVGKKCSIAKNQAFLWIKLSVENVDNSVEDLPNPKSDLQALKTLVIVVVVVVSRCILLSSTQHLPPLC